MLQKYFDKYGHKCALDLNKPMNKFLKNKSSLRVWFMRHAVISESHILLRAPLRSHAALRSEIVHQMEFYPYALHPYSEITYYLDIVWMIVTVIWLILNPLDVFPHLHDAEGTVSGTKYLKLVLSIMSLFDSIRRTFTGYYIQTCDSNKVVLDFKGTAFHYFKSYFLIDFISSIATFGILSAKKEEVYFVFRLMFLLRVFRLGTVIQVIINIMRFHHLNHYFIEILSMITAICFTVHLVACFSLIPDQIRRRYTPGTFVWYDTLLNPHDPVIDNYIKCLHRTLSILTGTGYNFFEEPKKSICDMVYTIFSAILGHILTLIIFAKVYEIVNGMRSSTAKYEEMLGEISNYMQHRKLSTVTQEKIITYYAYKYNYSYFNEHELLLSIPTSLRQNILLQNSRLLLDSIQLFQALPVSIMSNIVSYLAKEIVLPGDVLYRSGDLGKTMFFLLSGTTAAFTYSGREINHFEDGAEFGTHAFSGTKKTHITSIVVIETSELFKLPLRDYIMLVDYAPDLVEHIDKLTDQRRDFAELIEERYADLRNNALLLQEQEQENENGYGRYPSFF